MLFRHNFLAHRRHILLVPECILIRLRPIEYDAVPVDVEVHALQDDCVWRFARGEGALEIPEEVPEESLQGGAPSSLQEDPPCVVADVGYLSMA